MKEPSLPFECLLHAYHALSHTSNHLRSHSFHGQPHLGLPDLLIEHATRQYRPQELTALVCEFADQVKCVGASGGSEDNPSPHGDGCGGRCNHWCQFH